MRIQSLILTASLFVSASALAQEEPATEAPAAEAAPTEEAPAAEPTEGVELGTPEVTEVEAAPTAEPDTEPKTEAPKTDAEVSEEATVVTEQATPEEPVEAGLPMLGIAPRIGLTIPTSELGAFVLLGLSVDYFLPVLNNQLSVGLDFAWSNPRTTKQINDGRIGGGQEYDVNLNQGKIALDVAYRFFPHGEQLMPFAGIGPGLFMMRATEDAAFIPGQQKEQSTEFGFELFGGADFKMGPGMIFGELRYSWAPLDHELTGDTNAGHFDLSAGYRLLF